MVEDILRHYGLDANEFHIRSYGTGLINETFRITGIAGDYVLQRVNTSVFQKPETISINLSQIQKYLHNNAPSFLFVVPIISTDGRMMITTDEGDVYRLFPYIADSSTMTEVNSERTAFEAAKQFGRLTRLLADFDPGMLTYPIADFHNLELRYAQFECACESGDDFRYITAKAEIDEIYAHRHIVNTYLKIASDKNVPLRVIHHDTKISNVLFDQESNGLCVIDLDTLMPGFYTSDTGDMLRTYLSPVNEEEADLSLIVVRENYFSAIYHGYMSEMKDILTDTEKELFFYSGQLLMYMQALRFLTDYLNNDIYYGSEYPNHNLVRAKNQIDLLNKYEKAEARLKALMV